MSPQSAPVKTPISLLCSALDNALLSDRPTQAQLQPVARRKIEAQLAVDAGPDWAGHLNEGLFAAVDAFLAQPQDAGIRAAVTVLRDAAGRIDAGLVCREARPATDRHLSDLWWVRT